MIIIQITVREAINKALDEELQLNDNLFLIGEEIGKYNGPYKITKGLYDKYGKKRVIDTSISEYGFTGMAAGAAFHGLHPVVEYMTMNFSFQAIDHIINTCAKTHYMTAGNINVPIVFRGPNGFAVGVAAQHTHDFSSLYSSIPGLKVVSPYSSDDYRGLIKSACREKNPVIVLESELLYGKSFEISKKSLDINYTIPFGKAKIEREGKDITLVSYSRALEVTLEAAKKLKHLRIDSEVINLRSLRPLDKETIFKSVMKTNHLITIEDGWPQCGIGSEICGLIMESDAFNYLDSPVYRITGADCPTPYSENLERKCIPNSDNIVEAVKHVLNKVH